MNDRETFGVFAVIFFPLSLMVFVLLGGMSADLGAAGIQFMLGVAPAPVIFQNYRLKVGQSRVGMTAVGSGLFSIGVLFMTVGLVVTAVSVLLSAALWSTVAVQAFLYAKPKDTKPASPSEPVCVEEDPEMCRPQKVYEAPDENAGRMLQRGTLIVEIFDAHSPDIEAKATAVIKAALESMR